METTCPKCQFKFNPEALQFQVASVPEFEKHLSADARKVYNRQLRSVKYRLCSCGTIDCEGEDHTNTTDNTACVQEEREVVFMGGVAEISLVGHMMGASLDYEISVLAKHLAEQFNRGVQEGWLTDGCLGHAMKMDLVVLEPALRSMLIVYVGSPFKREELNERFGAGICTREGELPLRWDSRDHRFLDR